MGFLEFVRENADAVVALTKAVGLLVVAYGAWKVATSEVALAHLGLGLSQLIANLGNLGGAITTVRLLLMGAGGAVGVVGALGLLGVAAAAVGLAIGELGGAWIRSGIVGAAADENLKAVENWRKHLESVGVAVKNNEEALTIQAKLVDVNNKLREAGLQPLQASASLLADIDKAEKQLAKSTGDGNAAIEARKKLLEQFQEQLQKRTFQAGLTGLRPEERILREAEEDIRQVEEQLKKLPGATQQAQDFIIAKNLETQIKVDEIRKRERETGLKAALEVLDKQGTAIEQVQFKREKEFEHFQDLARKFPEAREVFEAAGVAVVGVKEEEITEILRKEFLAREALDEQRLQKRAEVLDRIVALERDNALGAANPFERIELQRIQRLQGFERDILRDRQEGIITVIEAEERLERARVASNAEAGIAMRGENERIFDEQARLIERNARQFELFWDRVIRGAKSTGDFLSNLWNELANQFRRMVLQSVASWVFGQRQIAGAGAGGLGAAGGFAGLLGGIFGTPGAASARTPPFVSSFLSGGGLGAGSAGGGLPGVGGAGAAGAGIPLGIPGLGSAGIPGLGGGGIPGLGGGGQGVPAVLGLLLGLEGARRGRPGLAAGLGVGGVLGGVALSGAAAGIAGGIGGLAGAGVGLAGFLTNPVGLAILGGVAGIAAIVGIVQRRRKKEDASAIGNDGFAQITELVARYSSHAATFESTITAMNRIWSQMESAWRQIGGSVGSNSITDQRRYFDAHVKQVQDIERERARRGDLISNLPTPQFATGGLVGPLGGMVHPGEYVIRREAVSETGVPMLQRINQGAPAGGGDTYNVEIRTVDKGGIEELIRGHWDTFKRAVVAMVKQSIGEFGLR
jgi:hypothetical protein